MKAVIQRVTKASVKVKKDICGSIQQGLVILLGIDENDENDDLIWMAEKISSLRIFDDENGVMNYSIIQIGGNAFIISQFTLCASTNKGNRPSYIKAARPEKARPMYMDFCSHFSTLINKKVEQGVFGSNMLVELINDGPVTIVLDSKNN